MKFKVEDKVKFIKEIIHHNVGIGGIFQIISISNDNFAPYLEKVKMEIDNGLMKKS